MKKFPSILFVFSLLFMLTACSSSADPSQESSGQTTSPSSQQDSVSVSNAVLESESTENNYDSFHHGLHPAIHQNLPYKE